MTAGGRPSGFVLMPGSGVPSGGTSTDGKPMAITLDLAGANAKKQHGGCGCGCSTGSPELALASIPKVMRSGAVIGGLTSLKPEQQVVLVADHDPAPLLSALGRVAPDAFDVDYLEQGPQTWRVEVTRR